MQVMLPQLPREDGWWEIGGQAQSGNSGCCHCNSSLTWEVCSHLSIAVILLNACVNTASVKESPGVQRKVLMAFLYYSIE